MQFSMVVFRSDPWLCFLVTLGSGKIILSQQIGFSNASPEFPAIFLQILTEPTRKTLRFLSQFQYFEKE